MEFSRKKHKKVTGDYQAELYGHCLQFYSQPPLENIPLSEFETFAIERLKLLKTVENLGVSYVKTSDLYIKKLDSEIKTLNFPYRSEMEEKKPQTGPSEYEKRRKDHISHFILRLAYCQTEDLRRWFIQQEMDLFRHRFNVLHPKYKNDFLRHNNLKYEKLTARSLPVLQSDERLQPLLSHLSHAYVGQDYSIQKNIGKVSLEQIDSMSTSSFPLCMRHLHRALREQHHLRHGGRMQYGLFLKGIGLTLEQALQFWRAEFIKGKVDADKFDKAYAYSIRHMFGKEGKRTDYTPYSCMKVILSNPPSQGDYHGCPFRHSDPELLKQKLQSYKIPSTGINQVLDLVKGMHYQLACQKYFELTHGLDDCGFSLSHPNQYFVESQKLLGSGREVKKEVEAPQKGQSTPALKAAGPRDSTASSQTDEASAVEDPGSCGKE
ncbi:DNA primase large subunit isoform X2 [Lepisosteus oculatus]|uniref:DNA primase large subunit isoform X2 n=1 Tax=Lepisosteus oculatus TaxID=7918 RepID=UPI0035F50F01